MKRSILRFVLLASGAALLILARAPGAIPTAYAIPLAVLTATAEPPTLTSMPGPTSTPIPSATAIPTPPTRPTFIPTNTPKPQPTKKPEPRIADPAVTKSANVSEARIGDIVDFTLTVTNYGNATADNVVVTDSLPDFLDLVDANTDKGTVATSGRTVVVMVGSVAPDEVITIHIRARVNAQAQPPGGRNSVTLTTSSGTDDPVNNVASVNIDIPAAAESPTPTATAPLSNGATTVAGGAPPAGSRTNSPRPNLPRTGAADGPTSAAWPLALLGLAAIALSLLTHRRGSRNP